MASFSSLRNQPPIWQPVLPAARSDDVVAFEKFIEEFGATAHLQPRGLHPAVESERNRSTEREGWILAYIIVGRRVAHLHGAVEAVSSACRPGTISPAAKYLDLEFVVGGLGNGLGEYLAGAIDRIERFRKARR